MFTLKARRRLESVWVCAQCCCSDLSHASSTTKQRAIRSLKTTYSASPYVKSCIHCSSSKCSYEQKRHCCSKCSGLFSLVSKPGRGLMLSSRRENTHFNNQLVMQQWLHPSFMYKRALLWENPLLIYVFHFYVSNDIMLCEKGHSVTSVPQNNGVKGSLNKYKGPCSVVTCRSLQQCVLLLMCKHTCNPRRLDAAKRCSTTNHCSQSKDGKCQIQKRLPFRL